MKTRNLKLIPALILALTLIIGCVLPITAAANDDFTLTFVTPSEIEAPAPVTGSSTTLPAANAPDGYTFVGWVEEPIEETDTKPATVYNAADTYAITKNTTLHALYSMGEFVGEWVLATDVSALKVGREIIIAAKDYNFAISTTQNNNNRGQAEITKDDDKATFVNEVQIITLEAGTKSGTFAFNVGNGYLYAASNSSNYLKTKSTLDDNGSWEINITNNGTATVIAQGSNSKNDLKYNSSSSLFSCYGSGNTQKAIAIYVKGTTSYTTLSAPACAHNYQGVETTPPTCVAEGVMTYTCTECSDSYTNPIEINPNNHSFTNGVYCDNCFVSDPENDLSGRYYIAGAKDDGTTYYVCGSIGGTSTKYYNIYESYPAGSEMPESITAPDRLFTFVLVKNNETNTYKIYAESVNGDENYMDWSSDNSGIFSTEAEALDVTVKYPGGGEKVEFTIGERHLCINYNSPRAAWYTSNTGIFNLNLIPVIPVEDQPAQFTGASLDIASDLSLLYHVKLEEGESIGDYSVRFTHGNNVIIDSTVTSDGDEGYTFYYTGITPQRMGDIVKAELLKNGEDVAVKTEFSVKHYVEAYKAQYGTDEISVFLDKLLVYGAAAQVYTEYNLENPILDTLELPDEDYNELHDLRNTSGNTDEDYKFTAAGLRFDYVNKFFVKFKAESLDGVSVQFGEDDIVTEFVEIGEGEYIAYSSELYLSCFDSETIISISVNDVKCSSIVYSGYSYLIAKWDSEGAFGDLVKALYFCADGIPPEI